MVFDFEIGFGLLIENIFIENIAFDLWQAKIGSGAAGIFRGSQNTILLMILEKLILNWSEAKGLFIL